MHNNSLDPKELVALKAITSCIRKNIFTKSNVTWLSIDFFILLRNSGIHFKKSKLAAHFIVNSIIDGMNNDQKLIISTFNFDFAKSKIFDRKKTEGQTGAFGNLLLEKYHENRIDHPFYSFIIFQRGNNPASEYAFHHSSGYNSIFDWLITNNTELVTVGHHYVKAFSTIHHAEHLADVDFRYVKSFSGKLHDNGRFIREIETSLYVRNTERCDFSSITYQGDLALRESLAIGHALITSVEKPILIHLLDLRRAHDIILPDLLDRKFELVDYFGPTKPNQHVITGSDGDKLYHKELASILD